MNIEPKSANLIVALTGASGSIFCVRLLQALKETEVRTHLVMSKWGIQTLKYETSFSAASLRRLADENYSDTDLGAPISSGSFLTMGMVVVPCSAKSLGSIAYGHGSGLIQRAADVVLKERRRLVLAVRETPLSDIHLENMLKLSRMGAVICPPVPAFYTMPKTIDDIIDQTVGRIIDQFGIHLPSATRWAGVPPKVLDNCES
ncbi:MAG: UbiX family flavin prenyltransferase [Methylocella sp.]